MAYYYNEFQVPRSSPSFYNYPMAQKKYFEDEPYHAIEPFYAIKDHYLEASWENDDFYAPPPRNSLEDTFQSSMEAQLNTHLLRFESLFIQLIEEQRDMKNQLNQLADALNIEEKEESPSESQSNLEGQQLAISSNLEDSNLDEATDIFHTVDDELEAPEEKLFLSEEALKERLFLKSEEVEKVIEEKSYYHIFVEEIIFDKVQPNVQDTAEVFILTDIQNFPDFEESKKEEFYEDLPKKIIKIWQPP